MLAEGRGECFTAPRLQYISFFQCCPVAAILKSAIVCSIYYFYCGAGAFYGGKIQENGVKIFMTQIIMHCPGIMKALCKIFQMVYR